MIGDTDSRQWENLTESIAHGLAELGNVLYGSVAHDEVFRLRARELVRRLALNQNSFKAASLASVSRQLTFNSLKLDWFERVRKRKSRLILPLDFTVLYRALHADDPDTSMGHTARYFIQQNPSLRTGGQVELALLPTTVWEMLAYFKRSADFYKGSGYEVISNSEWAQQLRQSYRQGGVQRVWETYTKLGAEKHLVDMCTELGKQRLLDNPLKILLEMADTGYFRAVPEIKELRPLRKKFSTEYVTWREEFYVDLQSVRERPSGPDSGKSTAANSRFDARYIADTLLLNHGFRGDPYFALITRGSILGVSQRERHTWHGDPVVEQGYPITRPTMYGFWLTLAHAFDEKKLDELEQLFVRTKTLTRDLLEHLTSMSNIREPEDVPGDLYMLVSSLYSQPGRDPKEADLEIIEDVCRLLTMDAGQFRQTVEAVEPQVTEWARTLFEAFKDYIDLDPEIVENDQMIAEILSWLGVVRAPVARESPGEV